METYFLWSLALNAIMILVSVKLILISISLAKKLKFTNDLLKDLEDANSSLNISNSNLVNQKREIEEKLAQLKARPETYEVKELLNDLLSGSALIQVTRVAPTDYFLRSPRDL